MIEIPCTPAGTSHWTQRTALDGQDFVLTFDWNQRTGGWYLTLADPDGVAIVSSRRLSTGYPVLRGTLDARRPAGELVLLDTQGSTRQVTDPTFASLGARHVLVHFTAAELV